MNTTWLPVGLMTLALVSAHGVALAQPVEAQPEVEAQPGAVGESPAAAPYAAPYVPAALPDTNAPYSGARSLYDAPLAGRRAAPPRVSTAWMVTGIVLTSVGPLVMLGGALGVAVANSQQCECLGAPCECGGDTIGGWVGVGVGAAMTGGGIALIVHGARREWPTEDSERAAVSVTPFATPVAGGAAFGLSGRF